MDRIGVRELRQHASRYLERVARGESIEVTDRGRPVARLVPVEVDAWTAMTLAGRVIPAADDGDIAEEAPGNYAIQGSALLEQMRADEV